MIMPFAGLLGAMRGCDLPSPLPCRMHNTSRNDVVLMAAVLAVLQVHPTEQQQG
jgi:hypothetical protein